MSIFLASSSTTLRNFFRRIQLELEFASWADHPQFNNTHGLGRVAMQSTILGMVWGIHICGALYLAFGVGDDDRTARMQLMLQWCLYVCALSTFHLTEFFTTALYNPSVTSSDSFLINHSVSYTAAAMFSFFEFVIRLTFFPNANTLAFVKVGLVLVVVAQVVRSSAMITCGESFNHYIQRSKKDNHVLITHGIYKYLRHPSYFGFFYWSVGTQFVLSNYFHIAFFVGASWWFFHIRIPYEEETLLDFFGEEYASYASKTWVGIPFIRSPVLEYVLEQKKLNDKKAKSAKTE